MMTPNKRKVSFSSSILARQCWGGKHSKAAEEAVANASSVGCRGTMNGTVGRAVDAHPAWVDADGGEFATMTTASRVFLSEVALRLRLALFTEIFTPTSSLLLGVRRPPAMSFSGRVAVLRMISEGFVRTEEAAQQLGNSLLLMGALCGTSGPATFSTSASCFYLFSVDRFALLADDYENGHLMDATRLGGAMAGFSLGMAAEAAHSMRKSSDGVATAVDGDGLRGFSGTDVVDWLITHGLAGSKDGAVAMADALVRAGVFANVAGDSNFRVAATRFAFAEDVFFAAVCAAFRSTHGGRSLPPPSGHATLTGDQALFIADYISFPDAALWNGSARALPHYLEPSYGL